VKRLFPTSEALVHHAIHIFTSPCELFNAKLLFSNIFASMNIWTSRHFIQFVYDTETCHLFLLTLGKILLHVSDKRTSGFGGLEVSVLTFGTRVRGFKPGRSRRIFYFPSFGGEVKPSVPCRKFTACDRTQK